MIGYYVHHHGSGHRHRAGTVARALSDAGEQVTGLSSLPRPADWPGDPAGGWLRLASDADLDAHGVGRRDAAHASPGGLLHWVPRGHPGLRARMAAIAGWVDTARPSAVVVDVSVEVALLVRLHGVPVVTVVQPGRRTDPAHLLGYGVSDALVACWPAPSTALLPGLPDHLLARVEAVGAVSRAAPVPAPDRRTTGPGRVVLLSGTGGAGVDHAALDAARAATPGWEWTVLDRTLGTWVDDPAPLLAAADVVVTHAGQNALAEIAAARTPAVVVPQDRPHDEQAVMGAALAAGEWPVVVGPWPEPGDWAGLLERAARLDGGAWAAWCDGRGADRFADVVRRVAR